MDEVLAGDSSVVGLFSVLQLIEAENLTGTVTLGRGEVRVYRGAVVDARFGDHAGLEALYELILWPKGRFVVHRGGVAEAPPLAPLPALLLEGCRLLDEWVRLERLVLARDDERAAIPRLAALAPHLDGRRDVRDAVARAGLLRSRVVDPILDGLQTGWLSVRASPPAANDDAADGFEDLLEQGRRLLREGRRDEARERLEQALRLRPDDRVVTQNLRRVAALSRSA